jgi:hypothetical protein
MAVSAGELSNLPRGLSAGAMRDSDRGPRGHGERSAQAFATVAQTLQCAQLGDPRFPHIADPLAVAITPAKKQERAQVDQLCQQFQEATAQQVKVAFVDQEYTDQDIAQQARKNDIDLVVECAFAWLGRFRRLAHNYERLSENLAAYHWLAATSLMLASLFSLLQSA